MDFIFHKNQKQTFYVSTNVYVCFNGLIVKQK